MALSSHDIDVVVVGAGYVGFPMALLLAGAGCHVVAVDVKVETVELINDGNSPIRGENLQEILDEPGVRARLSARTELCLADVFIIAVPTPVRQDCSRADLSFVEAAARSIVPWLQEGNLVILESTVPPRTCRDVVAPILESSGLRVGQDIFLAHCPERVFPGRVCQELTGNDRIIGAADEESRRRARAVYELFVEGELLETDDITAEFCKLMENAYRDVNIAFANEMAAVATGIGIDPIEAIALANRHPRVQVLTPGIGVGGHCIPVDPWFIHQVDPANTRLIAAARRVNDAMPVRIATAIREAIPSVPRPKVVAAGAAYKANTTDLRESPALEIVRTLRADGVDVLHYDPLLHEFNGYPDLAHACRGAHCLAVLVAHDVFVQELRDRRHRIESAMAFPRILEFGRSQAPLPERVVL